MATRQRCKKAALSARQIGKNARPYASSSPKTSKSALKPKSVSHPSKSSALLFRTSAHPPRHPSRSFGNPFAVPWPSSALSPQAAQRIVSLGRIQHRLWTWTLALALLLLVLVSFFELAPIAGWLPHPSAAREGLLEQADLTAMLVLVLEMAAQYRSASNKALFMRQNWFLILALLPFGILLRAASLLEGARAVRVVEAWGNVDELRVVLPSLDIPLFSPLVAWGESMARMLSQWTGLNEVIELLANISGRLFR